MKDLFYYSLVIAMTPHLVPVDSLKCNARTQRIRNNGLEDICCYTKKCGHNQTFESCQRHNSYDVCVDCPSGKCYDNKINTADFADPPEGLCAYIDDQCDPEQGADPVFRSGNCMPDCRCRVEEGFYGYDKDSRGCSHTAQKCDTPGMQLSNTTGKCVRCPDHQFKKTQEGFCVDKKRGCPDGEAIIDQGSNIRDIVCGVPGSEPPPTVSSAEATTKSAGANDSSNAGVIIGIVVGVPVALVLLCLLIWFIRREMKNKKKKIKEDIEMNPEGSEDNSTVSCNSCGNTLLTCTCTGSQSDTQVKQPYIEHNVEEEMEPGSGVSPSSELLTPRPSTDSEQGSQSNGIDVQTSTGKEVGETNQEKEDTASKMQTQDNIRPESLSVSEDQNVTNMMETPSTEDVIGGLFSSKDPITLNSIKQDFPECLDNEGNPYKERDKHVKPDPRTSGMGKQVAKVKGVPQEQERRDNPILAQCVDNDNPRFLVSGQNSIECRQNSALTTSGTEAGNQAGFAGGGTAAGAPSGTGSMSYNFPTWRNVQSLLKEDQGEEEQGDDSFDENTSLKKPSTTKQE